MAEATPGRWRTRIFIDYWNYQLSWNERMGRSESGAPIGCDWRALPAALAAAAGDLLAGVGSSGTPQVEETLLYASVDPATEAKLRTWLETTVDRMPSYNVTIRERRSQPRPVHCRSCGADTARCPACNEPLRARVEKGVDAKLVTDLLTLGWHKAYDLAVLVSSDARLHSGRTPRTGTWAEGRERRVAYEGSRPEVGLLGVVRHRRHRQEHLPDLGKRVSRRRW